MSVFTVYVDDSGTHNEASIVSGAFCVASARDWKKFERRWLEIGREAGFKYFHMTEFAGCRPDKWCRDCWNGKQTVKNHPWREWSNQKRKRVLKKLAETVYRYSARGFGVAITKADYENLVLNSQLKPLCEDVATGDRHYTFTVQICCGDLAKWRDKQGITAPMKYVFDDTNDLPQREQISQLFIQSNFGNGSRINDGFTPNGYAFESRKSVVQLLSADMLAWVSAKNHACEKFDKTMSTEGSIVWRALLQGEKFTIAKITTDHFQDWANKETVYRNALTAKANAGCKDAD